MPEPFMFAIPTLPKEVYETLKMIAKTEGCTQRLVVIAGVVALSYLHQHDPKALREVWKQAKALANK